MAMYDSLSAKLSPAKYCMSVLKPVDVKGGGKTIAAFKMARVFGNKCWYCDKESEDMTLDHVVPKSAGGLLRYYNVVLCCHRCNHIKQSRTLLEFLGLLK